MCGRCVWVGRRDGCATSKLNVNHGSVINSRLSFFGTTTFFDHALEDGETYTVVFGAAQEGSCLCSLVHFDTAASPEAWQAISNSQAMGYPTYCLGACGAHCGRSGDYLNQGKHPLRRAGVLAHDVCQAYHNLTDWGSLTNLCAREALSSSWAALRLLFNGQCSDGTPIAQT